MTSLLTRLRDKAQPAVAALLPGNRFFVRRLALDGPDVQAQVNLALEALSPFPLEQMLVGHLVAADGRAALIYAAHRRRFTPEESLAWPEDCQVVPEFLALCGHRPCSPYWTGTVQSSPVPSKLESCCMGLAIPLQLSGGVMGMPPTGVSSIKPSPSRSFSQASP